MAKSFSLAIYPWVYSAKFDDTWREDFIEQGHLTPEAEAALADDERERLYLQRNRFEEFPLVNFTTQYGLSCFEGLKAFPQPDGSLSLFRPFDNGLRMARSMEGLLMPAYPADTFVRAVQQVVERNRELGFTPAYEPAWEGDDFISARTVYVRPFSYAESGIGVDLSLNPWVIIINTTVGSYFNLDSDSSTTTTRRVRATPGGTGWIKCGGNYVISALAKKEAEAAGCMEAIFLDAAEHRYLEEGSSCNLFAVLSDGTLVTPTLGDTILPGITRQSVMTLAEEEGMKVEERRLSVEEVLDDAVEFFGTGTAAGVAHFGSLAHDGRTVTFGDGKIGPRALHFLQQLKGIQFGRLQDRHGWMVPVAS